MEDEVVTIKVVYDRQVNTLTVWFGDPKEEYQEVHPESEKRHSN